eukprot:CAMPEP_0168409934 /NCGR_PEP_ID=MMETSP0228-20121227/27436_1 /TAXON_ID=133427 /ORGANISM="Protoceratium reticulatum, Strain CCCM 535 (=CCMP 1889)" /LENGTH=47 /DNA_ID= /DNA_START= /DNA_END= /DNA_ORIENTATION=
MSGILCIRMLVSSKADSASSGDAAQQHCTSAPEQSGACTRPSPTLRT